MKKTPYLIVIALALIAVGAARGEVFNVGTEAELQNALDLAANNRDDDTINIAAGNYYTSGSTFSYNADSGEDYQIIISGPSTGKAVLDGGGSDLVMDIDTTGVDDDSNAHITVKSIRFQNGSGDPCGGLSVLTSQAGVSVLDCEIVGNTGHGASVSSWSKNYDLITYEKKLSFENNVVIGNTGRGVYVDTDTGSVSLTGNTFKNNGGGADVCSTTNNVTFINNLFDSNAADGLGGGAWANTWHWAAVTFTGNVFRNNTAEQGGGAYALADLPVTFTNNTFSDNVADYAGGCFACSYNEYVEFTNNIFEHNTANIQAGGAYGGPILGCYPEVVTFTNNTFTGNTAGAEGGGGLYTEPGNIVRGTLNIYNNIAWANTASGFGNDIYVKDYGGDWGATRVNLFNNDFGSDPNDFYIEVGDNLNQGENIHNDPLFVKPAAGDFHLQVDSPCIDAGTDIAPFLPDSDFEGEPRVVDGDGDGTAAVDIGADEYVRFRLEWVRCKITGLGRSGDYTVNGTISIQNRGNEPSGTGTLRVYLSEDDTLEGEDPIREISVPPIKGGKRIRKGFATKVPLPTYLRYLYFIAVFEAEGNEYGPTPVTLNGGVDLTGEWISFTKTGSDKRGMFQVRGRCSVKNRGDIPSGGFETQVYFAPSGSLDGTETAILRKPKKIPKLLAGKKKILRFNYKTDKEPLGVFFIVVDAGNAIDELDELNNEIPSP